MAGIDPGSMRITLRIDLPSGIRIGPGKAQLMELVQQHGSISAAGRAMGMSYRRAWTLVEEINRLGHATLITTQTGGAGGGGATLTQAGREILALYRRLESLPVSDTETVSELASRLAP